MSVDEQNRIIRFRQQLESGSITEDDIPLDVRLRLRDEEQYRRTE